jgi:pimeloyl-ACP methyl ester carboxylesterase
LSGESPGEFRWLEFESRGLALRGSAYLPQGTGPHPTTLLCHGFTGNRIETSRLFVTLSRELASVGIAAVAFDRAGHGESDGEFFDTRVSTNIADTLATLDEVASYEFVDSENLHLLGFSLGAVVASVVAAETHHRIRSLTMWSPAAVFADNARASGLPGQPDPTIVDGVYEFEGLRLGPGFLEDASIFEPYVRAAGYHGPARVLHGDQDFIPVEYARRYETVYGDAMKLTIVGGADHTWRPLWSRDLLIRETVEFILDHSGSADGELPQRRSTSNGGSPE